MKTVEDKRVTSAFGAAVRTARIRRNVSQEALGDLCELDRTYISGIERGVRNPTVLSIWRIAAALQVRPSELFQDAERTLLPEDEEA